MRFEGCIVLYCSIYIAPLNSRGQTEALLVRLTPRKETVLRSDKDVERLNDKREEKHERMLVVLAIHRILKRHPMAKE